MSYGLRSFAFIFYLLPNSFAIKSESGIRPLCHSGGSWNPEGLSGSMVDNVGCNAELNY